VLHDYALYKSTFTLLYFTSFDEYSMAPSGSQPSMTKPNDEL